MGWTITLEELTQQYVRSVSLSGQGTMQAGSARPLYRPLWSSEGALIARLRLRLDLLGRHAGRQLDQGHTAWALLVDRKDAEIGDHHVDDARSGERQRALLQELRVVPGRMLHNHNNLLHAGN